MNGIINNKVKTNTNYHEQRLINSNIRFDYLKTVFIIISCIVAELFISNRLLFLMYNCEKTNINLSKASFPDNTSSIRICNGEAILEKGVLQFNEIDREVSTICIETKNGNYRYIDLKVGFTDDNFALDGGFDSNSTTHRIYLDKNKSTSCIGVMPYGNIKKLRLEFCEGNGDAFTISSIKLNGTPPFRFSIVRFSFFVMICMLPLTVSAQNIFLRRSITIFSSFQKLKDNFRLWK